MGTKSKATFSLIRCNFVFHLIFIMVSFCYAGGESTLAAVSANPYKHTNVAHGSGELKVAYQVLGKGSKSLFFIHGAGCDLNFWRPQVDAFSSDYTIYLIDLPGHGLSEKPVINYDLGLMGQAVKSVMDAENLNESIFIGHSFGGAVLRAIYREWPEAVEAIVTVDAPLYSLHSLNPSANEKSDEYWLEMWSSAIRGMSTPNTKPAVKSLIDNTTLSVEPHVISSVLPAIYDGNYNFTGAMTAPYLALFAEHFIYADEAFLNKTEELFPQSSQVVVKGAGHFLMLDQPEQTNRLMREFFNGLNN